MRCSPPRITAEFRPAPPSGARQAAQALLSVALGRKNGRRKSVLESPLAARHLSSVHLISGGRNFGTYRRWRLRAVLTSHLDLPRCGKPNVISNICNVV